MDTFERTVKLIAGQTGISAEKITLETNFSADLKMDSLDMTDLDMAIEEEFSAEFSDEIMGRVKTVRDLTGEIEKILSAGGKKA